VRLTADLQSYRHARYLSYWKLSYQFHIAAEIGFRCRLFFFFVGCKIRKGDRSKPYRLDVLLISACILELVLHSKPEFKLITSYTLITKLMHWLLFIHKILFSSTCFEHQVLIFRGKVVGGCLKTPTNNS